MVTMAKQMYKQCNLSKPVTEGEHAGGTAFMTSWIRSELAIPGVVIDKMEDPETGRWENGWKVEDATEPAVDERLLIHRSHRTNVFGSLEANRTAKDKT